MTLEAWLARRHAELAAIRAQAHKELDELFDVEDRKLSLDRYRIARDLNELTQH